MNALDFRTLKREVSVEQVLVARGAPLRREGHRLVGPCPVHRGDNPRAFVADLSRNAWYCFTRCRSGGDVVELVRRMDRVGYREAAQTLAELAATPAPPGAARPSRPTPTPGDIFEPYVRRLDLDPDVPFLRAKGIRAETARRLECGRWPHDGFLAGCIGVRLHDPAGNPLGYAGRRLDPEEVVRAGKWKLPRRLPRRDLLYNYHRLRGRLDHGVVLTECAWSVMRLIQLGIPAVALLGVGLSRQQQALLAPIREVVILLDGDEAGRRAAAGIAARLATTTRVSVVDLPDGADPDDLEDDRLAALVRSSRVSFPF